MNNGRLDFDDNIGRNSDLSLLHYLCANIQMPADIIDNPKLQGIDAIAYLDASYRLNVAKKLIKLLKQEGV